jgi:hypothetical protein
MPICKSNNNLMFFLFLIIDFIVPAVFGLLNFEDFAAVENRVQREVFGLVLMQGTEN